MRTPHLVAGMLSVVLTALGAGVASGQDYPYKPIRIVTPGTGGGTDFASRLIAQGVSGGLGQQVVVDNRPSGLIPATIVSQAPPDGYTLLLAGGTFWIGALLQKAPYDPVKDFLPITLVATAPNMIVVHPSLPVKSVKELIALAKAKPGELNYAASGAGGSPHLAAELFKAMAGVNIVCIYYKGGGPALTDVIAGHVQLTFGAAGAVAPHIKSGRLRGLAVTSAQPSSLAPGVPTAAATGLPGYESASIYGTFVPAKTPEAIINRLNMEIVRVVQRTDVKVKFFNAGVETVGSSPQELAATVQSEMTRLGKVIKDAGIRAE